MKACRVEFTRKLQGHVFPLYWHMHHTEYIRNWSAKENRNHNGHYNHCVIVIGSSTNLFLIEWEKLFFHLASEEITTPCVGLRIVANIPVFLLYN